MSCVWLNFLICVENDQYMQVFNTKDSSVV